MLFLEKIKLKIIKDTKNIILQTRSHLKRVSQSVSKASMSVEAAFVVPIFLFSILQLYTIFQIFNLQVQFESALHQTAKELAVVSYGTNENEVCSLVISQAMVKSKVGKSDKKVSNLSFIHSDVNKNEWVDLVVQYTVEPMFSYMGFLKCKVANRCVIRKFTGYDNLQAENTGNENGEEIVYITESGSVFHRSVQCSSLKISVKCVSKNQLVSERNEDGEIYRSCEYCKKKGKDTVFITNYGNRYHGSILCSELKRSISAVPISQVHGRRACLKCG